MVFEMITSNPGITSAQIRSKLDPNNIYDRCIFSHVLTKLFRDGFVSRERIEACNSISYSYEAKPGAEVCDLIKDNRTIEETLITVILYNPGLTGMDYKKLVDKEGKSSKSVFTLLHNLSKSGFLSREYKNLGGLKVHTYRIAKTQQDGIASINICDEKDGWDGQGYPMIGIECEYNRSHDNDVFGDDWIKVKIFAVKTRDNCTEILWEVPGSDWGSALSPDAFRPIRTPAQIEAEERLLAAMDLHQAIHPGALWDMVASSVQARYLAAIDAGYGKTKGGAQ